MVAGLQYTNRKGDVYHLQVKQDKNGKLRYSFARQPSGKPVQHLPEGYEVREHPEDGQVLVRKIRPSAILAEEKALLERLIRKHTDGLMFIVDQEQRSLVVYTSEADADVRLMALREMFQMDPAAARSTKTYMLANARYAKMMRFELTDPVQRLFSVDRWCFLGSIDNWHFLACDQPLSVLAEKYVPHLGRESFFELMWGEDR